MSTRTPATYYLSPVPLPFPVFPVFSTSALQQAPPPRHGPTAGSGSAGPAHGHRGRGLHQRRRAPPRLGGLRPLARRRLSPAPPSRLRQALASGGGCGSGPRTLTCSHCTLLLCLPLYFFFQRVFLLLLAATEQRHHQLMDLSLLL